MRPDPDAPEELPPRPQGVPARFVDAGGVVRRALETADSRAFDDRGVAGIVEEVAALQQRFPEELEVGVAFHDGDAAALADFLEEVAVAASGPDDWRLRDDAAALARFARFAAEHNLWLKRD